MVIIIGTTTLYTHLPTPCCHGLDIPFASQNHRLSLSAALWASPSLPYLKPVFCHILLSQLPLKTVFTHTCLSASSLCLYLPVHLHETWQRVLHLCSGHPHALLIMVKEHPVTSSEDMHGIPHRAAYQCKKQ